MAADDHADRSAILDLGREIAEIRRELTSRRIRRGLEAAHARGVAGGCRTVVTSRIRADIMAQRRQGQSLRAIATAAGISVGTVHSVLAESRPEIRSH